jgi:inosine/xanthosine triphosphate pyrophosphatase family protein
MDKAKHLLMGTHNQARITMVRQILKGKTVTVRTLDELGIVHEVEEDGTSPEQNAREKAQRYFEMAGIPTLAMDGGLKIDRFPPDNQPGVLVKRMPGIQAGATDHEIVEHYIRELEKVGGESPATWSGSHVLAVSDHELIIHNIQFTVWFTKNRHPLLLPGRPLDSLMIDPERGKYYAELPYEDLPYYGAIRDFLFENIQYI